MPNFNPVDALTYDTAEISYNYGDGVDIYSTDIKKLTGPGTASKYYEIIYDNGANTNLVYTGLTPSSYTATKIYFFGLLHNNILGVTDGGTEYTGEVVIEHTNQSNLNKIYTCFFVKPDTTNTTNTGIDKLKKLANKDTTNALSGIKLSDNIISPGKYFSYNDTTNPNITVFVFYDIPITVSSSTSTWFSDLYKKSPLFTIDAPLVQAPAPAPAPDSQSDSVANDDNQILIDCNPSGESDETIATYNLPINSELMGQKTQMDFMKTTVNFFIFIIATLLAYFAIPALYKKIVIDKIIKDGLSRESDALKTRIRSIDIFISLLVAVGILTCFFVGFTEDDFSFLSGGLFLLVVFALSFALIYAKKSDRTWTTDDIDYNTGIVKTEFLDFLDFLKAVILFIVNDMKLYYFAALLITATIIFVVGAFTGTERKITIIRFITTAILLMPVIGVVRLLIK